MLPEFLSETNPNSLGVSVCIVILTSALYYFVIYPLFFHPLAKIPGPLPCKITKYWLIYKSWKEEKIGYVQSLHEKYGSIVRIGPDQVDICDASYIKDIYVANFDKTDFFAHFLFFGVPCAFSTIEKEKHKEFRKPTNRLYTKSKICSPQVMPRVEKVIYDTLSVFHQYHNHELNIFLVFCDMAMDAVTSISFGLAYDPLLADPFGKGKTICGDFSIQSSPGFWVTEMPYWLDWVVTKPVKEATKRCHDWVERQFNAAYQKLGSTTSKGVDIVLNSYFEYDPEEDKNKQLTKLFDQTHAKSEIYDHIVAGHIGTSTILTYFFLEMASQPEVQEKLREEVMKQLNNNEPIPTNNFNPIGYSVIDDEKKLPYLHACLNENFRLFTGVGQLPRVVPPKGMIFRGSEIVPPVKIPCNSVVSMQPWSVHRVAAVFPNPNKYDPQRWLEASEVQLKTMKSHLSPFGTGARMCLGQHLATAEVKMIMANILCRYKVQLADDFDYEKDGAMRDFFVTVPKSEKMMLKFIPLESSTPF